MNSRRGSDADSIFGSLSGYFDHDLKNMARTPPSCHGPSSYELGHFGKRMRAGSISGRLRSASDLEENGVIKPYQKDFIKDLIINGDDTLQQALDKYENGDLTALQELLKSGKLNDLHESIDLLDDVDLDYLRMNDFDESEMPESQDVTDPAHTGAPSGPQHTLEEKDTPKEALEHDDGIGDLDFDGGDCDGIDYYGCLSSDQNSNNLPVPKSCSAPTGFDYHRSRLNSLGDLSLDSSALNSQTGNLFSATPPMVFSSTNWANVGANKDMFQLNSITASTSSVVSTSSGSGAGGIGESVRDIEEKIEEKKSKPKKAQKKKNKDENTTERRREEIKLPKKKGIVNTNNIATKNDKVGSNITSVLIPQSPTDLLPEERPDDWVGAYSPQSRRARIERFLIKRNHRVWTKKVKYDVRKNFADSRLRVKGRFVKKEDELLMRELMSIT